MDESTVFRKTPKGVEEMNNRSGSLSLMVRRILIMTDGQRSVGELAAWVRSGEIANVMNLLESQGFVQRADGATMPMATVPLAAVTRPAVMAPALAMAVAVDERVSAQTFEETRRRALKEVTERLGPDGDHIAQRIERCRSNEDLRDCVREAERLIAVFYKEVAAQDFVRALRRR